MVYGSRVVEELDRHQAIEPLVARLVDGAHPALAEELERARSDPTRARAARPRASARACARRPRRGWCRRAARCRPGRGGRRRSGTWRRAPRRAGFPGVAGGLVRAARDDGLLHRCARGRCARGLDGGRAGRRLARRRGAQDDRRQDAVAIGDDPHGLRLEAALLDAEGAALIGARAARGARRPSPRAGRRASRRRPRG